MQSRTPFFDDLARLASGAVGTAQTLKEEMETVLRSRMERWAAEMAFATREEVDAAMTAALNAEARSAALAARLAELESKVGQASPADAPGATAERRAASPRRRPTQPGMLRSLRQRG